jgi:glycosyltransferase involved in cell wall biosynthesis
MSREKVLIISDSIMGPTGFANNGASIAWMLSKEYDVHSLGLQSTSANKIKLNFHNEVREVVEHPNLPRGNDKWDFGAKSLPHILDRLKPDILLTINDIQMVQHIPRVLYQDKTQIPIMDPHSKTIYPEEVIKMSVDRAIQEYKERYPLDLKWIMAAPQDGEPPMPQWKSIYESADQVVAFAKYGQDIFKKYFNMEVPYIYHAIDTDLFSPKDKPEPLKDKFVIGNLNRNQPRKQPVRTIQAFAKFAKDKPDVLLHMQMDWNDIFGWPIQYFGQLYGCIDKMIQPRPVGMPREQIVETYNLWDINVNSHGGEGFGISYIEGSACELPNIATDYTTTNELIIDGSPGPRGISVPPKELYWEKMDVAAVQRSAIDVDKLSDAFNTYYYNRDLIKQHGENGRKWVEKNASCKVIQHQWVDLVKDVLKKE